MLERTLPPTTGSFPEVINIQKAESHQLKNGIPLFVLRAGTQPVVKLELLFQNGGNGYENKSGQSFFANKLLNAGTACKSSSEISTKFAEFGASIEINPSFDGSSISLLCLEKHLVNILSLFISMITEASYPEEELTREKDFQITNLRIQQAKTNVRASKSFRNTIFPDGHPYGNVLNEDQILSLSRQDLQSFHRSHLTNYDILITGSFSDSTLSFIKQKFESLECGSNKPTNVIPKPEIQSPLKLKHSIENSIQSSIRIGKRTINKQHDDYIVNLITNHVLGGYFGSRLMKNIREEKGLTYGIYSSIVNFKEASYFVIGADVKGEFVDQAIKEIYREINLLSEAAVTEEELLTVKSHMIGNFQSELNSAFALGSKFKNIHQFDMSYDYYDRYLTTVKSVTSDQILNCAQDHLNSADMTEIVVG